MDSAGGSSHVGSRDPAWNPIDSHHDRVIPAPSHSPGSAWGSCDSATFLLAVLPQKHRADPFAKPSAAVVSGFVSFLCIVC